MPLSDLAIKKAKPQDKPYKLSNEKGIYILVQPTGGKLWRMNYRFDGKQKTLYLGAYPDISITDARSRRDDSRALLADGVDPAAAKQEAKIARAYAVANSFEAVALEWHSKQAGRWSDDHADRVKQRLIDNLFPALGKQPIESLKTKNLLEPLRQAEERDALDLASVARVRSRMVDPSTDHA